MKIECSGQLEYYFKQICLHPVTLEFDEGLSSHSVNLHYSPDPRLPRLRVSHMCSLYRFQEDV